jgi:transcription antitermination factor NusG
MNAATFDFEVERWAALRTAARWEKKVADELHEVGVPTFVPIVTKVTRYSTKTKTAEIPMFSGYVFCSEAHFVGNKKVAPSTRRQIAQFLKPPSYGVLREELKTIAEVTSSHRLVQEKVYGQVGDHVRIVRGSMSGAEGVILQLKPNQRRLVLEVSFLGARLDVEVDESLIVRVLD